MLEERGEDRAGLEAIDQAAQPAGAKNAKTLGLRPLRRIRNESARVFLPDRLASEVPSPSLRTYVVDQTIASWNQLISWLQQIEHLKLAG